MLARPNTVLRRSSSPWILTAAVLLSVVPAPGLPAAAAPPRAPVAARPEVAVSPSRVLATVDANSADRDVFSVPPPRGSGEPGGDRTLAPFFQVLGGDGQRERLPLSRTSAEVSIAGVIARVKVSQLYLNSGRQPLEAIYVFPASTRAAVHGMRMTIGGRVVEARIERREAARQQYQQARQAGQRTSLLEQERSNVFTMNVANVMPGDRITVDLEYSELLVPDEGIYEFVYPTVVGPRYGGGADGRVRDGKVKDAWIASPYLPPTGAPGAAQGAAFHFTAQLDTGIDLKDLSSPSHPLQVTWEGRRRAQVRLAGAEGDKGVPGDRDFVVRYRLAGDRIETGVLLWEGTGSDGQAEKYFALMLEPPARPAASQVPPREYIFLVDVSGSMHGFPLETARTLLRQLLGGLRPIDRFNVVLFAGDASTLAAEGSLPASPENLARAMAVLDRQNGGGGTELLEGLKAAYRIPRPEGHVSRTVVVVTDGFVGVEPQTFRFVRERAAEANLFAFGIGSSVNRGLIEGMARAGQGEPFVVLSQEQAAGAADRLRRYIEQPVLTGVEVKWNGFAATEVVPARLPDLLARRPLLVLGKYQGPASGRIDVTGWQGAQVARFQTSIQVRPEDVRPQNAPLRQLWARRWVDILDDEHHMGGGKIAEEAITQLGLGHRILTSFTSFVAIDSARVNPGAIGDTVKQPLPLPAGVSLRAVASGWAGGVVGGAAGGLARGQGSLAGRRARAPSVAASAPKMKGGFAEAAAAEPEEEDVEAGVDDEQKASAPVRVLASKDLSAPDALVSAVKLALAGGTSCLARSATTTIEVVLRVDQAGKVIAVEPSPGVPRLPACIKKILLGLASATRAMAGPSGELRLRLTLGAGG